MRPTIKCLHCGEPILGTRIKQRAKYCTPVCRERAKKRRAYVANPARFRGAALRWRAANRPKYLAQKRGANRSVKRMVDRALARALRKGVPFSIGADDVVVPQACPVLGIALRCATRGESLDASPSLDRIVPALGYVPGNVRVISFRANRLKADATAAEMRLVLADLERLSQSPSAYERKT